jgi:hypothetical protein
MIYAKDFEKRGSVALSVASPVHAADWCRAFLVSGSCRDEAVLGHIMSCRVVAGKVLAKCALKLGQRGANSSRRSSSRGRVCGRLNARASMPAQRTGRRRQGSQTTRVADDKGLTVLLLLKIVFLAGCAVFLLLLSRGCAEASLALVRV